MNEWGKLCKACSIICSYILHTNIMHWKHIWHMDKSVDTWNTNLWMNKCHTNFSSSYKFMFWMCFHYTILMHEMYEFCAIFIIKSWDVKFVMHGSMTHKEEDAYVHICILDWNWCFHNLNDHKLGTNDWPPNAHFLVVLLKVDWPSMMIIKSSMKTFMKVMKP